MAVLGAHLVQVSHTDTQLTTRQFVQLGEERDIFFYLLFNPRHNTFRTSPGLSRMPI